MIRKSAKRFSEKIVLRQKAKARWRALVDAAIDPDPLASEVIGLYGQEHGAQPLDLIQKPVDQAGRVQHRQTHAPQALCYLIDHRVPSVSMTSLFDTNA